MRAVILALALVVLIAGCVSQQQATQQQQQPALVGEINQSMSEFEQLGEEADTSEIENLTAELENLGW